MSTSIKADPDSVRLSSLSDPEEDIPIDTLDEAKMFYTTGLPPFIQKNLDPTVMPGDKHQAIPKTNSGTIPSIHSTKRIQLVCRAWKNNNRDRFWTYDLKNVRYIVRAFRTHAQPKDVPKISYHVWEGMGGESRFQKTQVAFDADDRLYGPDAEEKFIRPGFGTVDTNKEIRAYVEISDHILARQGRSSTKGKAAFNLRTKAFPERDKAGEDDEEEGLMRPITRSMKREKKTCGRPNSLYESSHSFTSPTTANEDSDSESAESFKSQGQTKPEGIIGLKLIHDYKGDGNYQDKFCRIRERLNKRRDIIKIQCSSDSESSYDIRPKTLCNNREECGSDSGSSYNDKSGKLSTGRPDGKADGISERNSSYHARSRKEMKLQDKLETDGISERNSSYHARSRKEMKLQVKVETDGISDGGSNHYIKSTKPVNGQDKSEADDISEKKSSSADKPAKN